LLFRIAVAASALATTPLAARRTVGACTRTTIDSVAVSGAPTIVHVPCATIPDTASAFFCPL
jgi:hypothetical protein